MTEKICVVGLGYIGLPTASLLATKGFDVHGVDVNADVVETINDMVSWTSSGVTEDFTKSINGGMEFVIYKVDKAFTDADAPKNQFMRLNVTTSE